ncbi:Predicted carbamoyl transferase, NodU family [Fictibacillus solisalsi]|uniref:Predicted carbamoyl transferase, NodU family n=1 Tax=Fictibacillus solisalsi TaxID=459525 RepID=A0A1H0BRQ0_9BACL|nr:carbamoyltransferase C-terminal domain-containing protein [Fictibacillus solisalsi]SDN48334.1 Predicted carbamoyl transferase, NodU family [Fictibacillus solisalsi]
MRNGYYLSTYLHIDPIDHLLNKIVRHDQNLALFKKTNEHIELIRFWELERISGIKEHHQSFASLEQAYDTINLLLCPLGLSLDDIEEIWGTPSLDTTNDYHSLNDYPNLSYHSISHLFSSIMLNSNHYYEDNIIGFAVDGGPDGVIDASERIKKPYYAGCFVHNGNIELFPVESPGLLWGWAMFYFGMKEGTLMALASASNSRAYINYEHHIPIYDGKGYFGKENYFESIYKQISRFTTADEGVLFNYFDPRFTEEENKISMLMKIIQEASYTIMELNIDRAIKRFGFDPKDVHLAMSGGFTLNCPTNSYLMKKYGFKNFIAPPCVGDSGLSLGMGLYAFYKKMGRFSFSMDHPFFGENDPINLNTLWKNYEEYIEQISPLDFDTAVEDIAIDPVVWFNGHSEIGPRALGNRSIISDPRSQRMKDRLNEIKQREWWRPVAPMVLDKLADQWFKDFYPSPLMLHTFLIQPEKVSEIPAVAHLDDSARVQSISKEQNPLMYKLIKHFYTKTGVPILCNTSLNDKGEPIINRAEEAINFCLRKGLKLLYINGYRISLKNHHLFPEPGPKKRRLEIDCLSEVQRKELWAKVNPHNIPLKLLDYYREPLEHVRFLYDYDLTKEDDAKRLINDIRPLMKHSMFASKGDDR